MDILLNDKNAIVCGSTQGIGKATAVLLAQNGANVTLVSRTEEKLKNVVAELPNNGNQQHDYIVYDFSDSSGLEQCFEDYLSSTGKTIHVLVNNTGGPPGGPIVKASTDAFLSALNSHLICNHIMVKAVLEGMKAAQYGRIINIISTSVKIPINNLGVSNTTRGAVASWAKTLANEVAADGITVNNVLPGFTETARLQSIIDKRASVQNKSKEEVANAMKAGVPARRFGKAEEVANAVGFLVSPAAAYINGVSLPVDGGRTGCI